MLIGQEFQRLEKRITAALCSGTLRVREAGFLQNISRNITFYGERAFISASQASWLLTILTNFEREEKSRSHKARSLANKRNTKPSHSPEEIRRMRIEMGFDPDGFDASDTPPTPSSILEPIKVGIDSTSLDALEERPEVFDISRAIE